MHCTKEHCSQSDIVTTTHRTLTRSLWIPRPIKEVFTFFADVSQLQRVTPSWMHFRVEGYVPSSLTEGTIVNFRLKLRGIPFRWTSIISLWDPPHGFVDEQLYGPFKLWKHQHKFSLENGGTRVEDVVTYRTPIGGIIEKFVIRPDLNKIFDYRERRITQLLG